MQELSKEIINKLNQQLFAQYPGNAYWLDEEGRYLGCNQSYSNFLGIKNEKDLWGKNALDLLTSLDIHVDTVTGFNGHFEKSYIFAHESTFKFKVTQLVSNNIFVYLEEELSHYLKHIKRLEKKCISLENKKNKTEAYLNNLIQIVPASVYWKDANSIILGGNLTHAKLAGFSRPEEVIGKTEYDFVWKHQAASIIENDRLIMQSGQGYKLEETATLKDGAVHTFLTSKEPLWDKDNNITGIIGISLDITDRKKIEKELHQAKLAAEAASKAKSEFIANMSHDIRTPLTGVVGMAKLIEDNSEDENIRQYARYLEESGNQLFNMLNNILDMIPKDRLDDGKEYETCFDLRKMLQNLVELERPSALLKKINLISNVNQATPEWLIGNPTKLNQILLNLVGNAIKFTNEGYVKLSVDYLENNQSSVLLRFYVIDSGIGIPPEFRHKVFEQFSRGTPSHKGLYKGYGLGLHIAQTYANALGTHIEFTSEVGKGTSFSFELSLKIANAPAESLPIERPVVAPTNSIKRQINLKPGLKSAAKEVPIDAPQILLVEDNKIALLSLENIIKKVGCRFISAMDGENAFNLATTLPFDLIIMDIGLPGMSGLEVSEHIRQWEKEHNTRMVPIVALTGHAKEELESKCCLSVINKVMTKPMSLEKLEGVIAEFISVKPEPEPKKDTNKQSLSNPNLKLTDIKAQFSQVSSAPINLGLELPEREEQLFELGQYPLLDIVNGVETVGSKESLLEMLKLMLIQTPQDKVEIEHAYASGDWEKVEKLAHRAKSGASYSGTIRMKYACQYLERYHKAGYSQSLERLYQQLFAVIDETIQAINQWLNRQ
ncbi:MAG: response regulator [Tatlockia sp.]|nr:response regulator [Tatlockia sp.]